MTVETGTDPQQSVTGLTTYVAVVRQRMRQRIADTDDRVHLCANDITEFAKHVWLSDPVKGEMPFAMWDWQPGLLDLWVENRLV